MDWLISDQGLHFISSLMKNLTQKEHARDYITTAYCPWENGTVEKLCKEVLSVTNALLSG